MDELLNIFAATSWWDLFKDFFVTLWIGFIIGTSGFLKRHLVKIGNYLNKESSKPGEENLFSGDDSDDKIAMTIAIMLFIFFVIIEFIVSFFAT